jgi:hypothetical protein
MDQKNSLLGFREQDLDQVIQEARLAALKRVQEKLTQRFEEFLMEKALEKMEAFDSIKNELPEEKDDSPLLYLFGIAPIEGEEVLQQRNLYGMVDEEPVYPVIHKELLAIVCTVPKAEFTEEKIQEVSGNRDWLEEKAERHQEIISLFAEKYPIIPMRFSTLYPSEEQLKLFMKENYQDLMALLKKIRHKSEWSLKLYLDEDKFKKFLQEKDQGINKLMEEMSLNLTGKEYLLKKRLANRIERKAFDLAEEVHRRLCRFSAEAVLNKLLPQEVTGRKERMILNGAYLLETTQKEGFLQTVNLLDKTEGPRGFIFEVSGPWPCYNFCRISSAST